MKHLKDYITEQEIAIETDTVQEGNNGDEVYVVYFGDGTMYNYFTDEKDAQDAVESLNKEVPSNKATIKKEPISNIRKD